MERRQSGLPRPSNAVPATPGAAASASRFGFRATSSATAASAAAPHASTTAPSGPSSLRRGGVASSGPAMPGSAVKRTASQAGMPSSDSAGALAAPATRRALGTTTILGPTSTAPSSPYDAPIPQHLASSTSSPSSGGAAAALVSELERKLLVSSSSYERLEHSFRELGAKLDRLERERVELLRAWEDNQDERKADKKAWGDERCALNAQLSALRTDKAHLSERNLALETAAAELQQSSRSEASTLKVQNARLEAEVEALKAEIERQKVQSETQEKERREREREWEEERGRLTSMRGDDEESRKVAEELNRQMSHIRSLESDLSRLRADNERLSSHRQSVEVLKEEKAGLEHKVRALDETRRKLEKSEMRCDEMEAQRRAWTERLEKPDPAAFESAFASAVDMDADPDVALSVDEAITLDALPHVLSHLRGGLKGLLRRSNLLSQRCRTLQGRVEQMEEQEERKDKEVIRLSAEREAERGERMRAERKAEMSRDEAARYRQIFETYESEAKSHAGSYEGASAERISSLEARLAEVSAELEEREAEARSLRQRVADVIKKEEADASSGGSPQEANAELLRARVKELSAELEGAKAAVESLSSQLDKEADRASRFEMRLGRGEYDAGQERVLEMKLNPVSKDLAIRSSTLETYRKENEGLRQRVAELLSSGAGAGAASVSTQDVRGQTNGAAAAASATPPNSEASNLELVKELRSTIEAKDKVLLRLRQTFSSKAKEYRETFESLFGFKIKYLEDGRVKLSSVFARSTKKGTTLLFSSDEGDVGRMRLHGEALEGMANVKRLKEYWLGAQQSVPCFLAALQLELYENTTRAMRGGWVVAGDEEE